MLKILIVILVFLLVNLQYHLWFGKGSYQEYHILKHKIEQQQRENITLKNRNEALRAEVVDLKHGLDAIEERARLELGMIKRDEVFYQIVE